ncbi:hypothetical protein ACHAWF_001718 [Thalassiosira exigua]
MVALEEDATILARLGVEPAKPFDWEGQTRMTADAVGDKAKSPADAFPNAPSSGLESLLEFVRDQNDEAGTEKGILRSLMGDAGVDVSSASAPSARRVDGDDSSSQRMERMERALAEDPVRDVSIKGLSDRAVAELAVESRTSLFGSIMRLFEAPRESEKSDSGGGSTTDNKSDDAADGDGGTGGDASPRKIVDPMIAKEPILSTAEIVRSVHIAARPGDIPPGMDSKEYTMAALHFLASYVPFLHEDESDYRNDSSGGSQEGWDQLRKTLPVLPLIKSVNPGGSLELRCYRRVRPLLQLGRAERKEYPDSMDHDQTFQRKVLNLERLYSSSLPYSMQSPAVPSKSQNRNDLPFSFQRYVSRRKLVPHIVGGAKEELTFMISGHMQQPQHAPSPKLKVAKPKSTGSGSDLKVAIKPTSSTGDEKSTSLSTNEERRDNSTASTSKRKAEHHSDSSLHPAKKTKDFII